MNFGIRITVGISVAAPSGDRIPANALTLGGEAITLGGQTITLETP